MPGIRFNPILTPPISKPQSTNNQSSKINGSSFEDLLSGEISKHDGVKFSKHAQTRLESRNIELQSDDMDKLNNAVSKASSKGVQDSLIVMNGLAFIVNVPDRMVVTAMPVSEASSNVFTNIDGAVIA